LTPLAEKLYKILFEFRIRAKRDGWWIIRPQRRSHPGEVRKGRADSELDDEEISGDLRRLGVNPRVG
jgi:hypothetical protein